MLQYSVQPIQKWPGERKKPGSGYRPSPFRSSWGRILYRLEYELDMLNATDVVIQLDCDRSQLTNNGKMKAGTKPRTPAVILSFETKDGAMSFPCETYADWMNNIHAIALSLEALRAVDRHGVTRGKEQYQGWLALEDKSHKGPFPTADAASDWVCKELGVPLLDVPWNDDTKKTIRRDAMTAFHPDKNGGLHERWSLWQHAAVVLGIEV